MDQLRQPGGGALMTLFLKWRSLLNTVYLKLPWIGKISEQLQKQVKVATEKTFMSHVTLKTEKASKLRCI